jgi:hypothetical protein
MLEVLVTAAAAAAALLVARWHLAVLGRLRHC